MSSPASGMTAPPIRRSWPRCGGCVPRDSPWSSWSFGSTGWGGGSWSGCAAGRNSRALGVPVHSVREGGEVSDLVANILASVAEEESRALGERVAASEAAHDRQRLVHHRAERRGATGCDRPPRRSELKGRR